MSEGIGKRLKKASKSKYADVLGDSEKFTIRDWISTGNYALNSLICGNPFKGFPAGRILQLAGPQSVGKSYIAIEILKAAQAQGYFIVMFDTEFAQDKESMEERGLDPNKILYIPVNTVEELSTSTANILKEIADGEKVLMVIDSIGNLSTTKELEDIIDANDKRDMTRAQKLRAFFRANTLTCGMKGVPMIVVNHVYASIGGYGGGNTVGGGGGSLYASSTILELFKSQVKDGDEHIGSGVLCKSIKNRMAREKMAVRITIDYTSGINPYSGLLELAELSGFLPKSDTGRFVWTDEKGKEHKLTKKTADNPKVLASVLENPAFVDWISNHFKYQTGLEDILEDGADPEAEDSIEEA